MARIAQAREMKTDFPAFELASKTKAFQILLFQHDGFSVHFTKAERESQWRTKIKAAVDSQAKKLGIPTSLKWDEEQIAQREFAARLRHVQFA